MSETDAPVTIAARAAEARARLDANGVNVTAWSREHGFSRKLVHHVLSGDRACRRGESHRIAIALGIKPEPVSE